MIQVCQDLSVSRFYCITIQECQIQVCHDLSMLWMSKGIESSVTRLKSARIQLYLDSHVLEIKCARTELCWNSSVEGFNCLRIQSASRFKVCQPVVTYIHTEKKRQKRPPKTFTISTNIPLMLFIMSDNTEPNNQQTVRYHRKQQDLLIQTIQNLLQNFVQNHHAYASELLSSSGQLHFTLCTLAR